MLAPLFAAALAAASLPAACAPPYQVLDPAGFVEGGQRNNPVREVAELFAPRLEAGPGLDLPRTLYFQVLETRSETIRVLYFAAWPDERHPIAPIHWLYRAWRRFYFGSAEDWEYIWVEGDLRSRLPQRLAFEAPRVGRVLVAHVPQVLSPGSFQVEGSHPLLRVESWNHLFSRAARSGSAVPLEPLPNELFDALKGQRRSLPSPELLRAE